MPLLVTSASGVNGDGYGSLLAFDRNGAPLGVFCNDECIADPRGLVVHQHEGLLYLNSGQDRVLALDAAGTVVRDTGPIEGPNPGGGNFGPDGRYYVGLRTARTVTAFPRTLHAPGEHFLAPGIVPFPRGFAFGRDGRLFLGSGIGPTGEGDNTIVAFAPNNDMPSRLVSDPELSPLDLAIARVGPYDPNLAPQRTGGASDDGVGVSGAGLRAGGAAGRGGGAEILAMSPAICC